MVVGDLLSFFVAGEEVLLYSEVVIVDDRVGCIEDGRGGPVVLSHDHISGRLPVHELLKVGTSPFVDGLVRVSDQKEVAVQGAEGLVDLPVVGITVLHLVDQHVVHLPLPLGLNIREVLKDIEGEVDKVLKVQ